MEKFEYTDENLRKLQLVELEMLKELDRLCRKNNIKYVLEGGTLLGAVRHGGFIPWDDDIDVRMLREEYDRFCEVCAKQLDSRKYFLQTYKTDPSYRWGYARILKVGTVYCRKDHEQLKSRTGIFIDIFPSDNLPEQGVGRLFCNGASWLCRKALYSEVGRMAAPNFWRRSGFFFLNLFPKQWFYKLLETLTERYKNINTKQVRCFSWGAPEETAGFQKEWMQNTQNITFEGFDFLAPSKIHEYLVHLFGEDYMTPPPPEERVPRHVATYIKF